ncbi:oxidoreductase [Cupriavidus basilensis]
MTESDSGGPEGRITPSDLGIWSDDHIAGHRDLVAFIVSQGAVPGIQLAHAGRKASRVPPWESDPGQTQGRPLAADEGGWTTEGASPVPFDVGFSVPQAMDSSAIAATVEAFEARRSVAVNAGYPIEVHAAHGYLAALISVGGIESPER